jgi:hypothetical protein
MNNQGIAKIIISIIAGIIIIDAGFGYPLKTT